MVTITTSPGAAIASGTCAPETEGIDTEKRHATTMPVGAGGFIVDLHLWVVRNFGPSIKSPSKIGQRFGVASAPLWDVLSSWATTDDQGCREPGGLGSPGYRTRGRGQTLGHARTN